MKPCWNRSSPFPSQVGPAGVEPASYRVSDGCLAARSPARFSARTEGIEPSACGLEPHCSPRSTSLFLSCPGRIRTCTRLGNNQPHNHCATGHQVRMVGFEPTISSTPNWRIAKLSHILLLRERPGGFEPPHPPWQGGRLPSYIMDALVSWRHVSNLPSPQYPWQESNLHDLRLRRAACLRHTPGIFKHADQESNPELLVRSER
jgi:hypothetical protein